eukprot:793736-Amphidinium_carterae.1
MICVSTVLFAGYPFATLPKRAGFSCHPRKTMRSLLLVRCIEGPQDLTTVFSADVLPRITSTLVELHCEDSLAIRPHHYRSLCQEDSSLELRPLIPEHAFNLASTYTGTDACGH